MAEAAGGADDASAGVPLHLLRLVSQGLPVGAFSYSRGLEGAVHAGWIKDEAGARDWILGILQSSFARFDGALFWRMCLALHAGDHDALLGLDAWLAAGRESAEFQREDRRLGAALVALLRGLNVEAARTMPDEMSFAGAFAIAAHHWHVPPHQALEGLLWTYAEGQVAAATRLVPLGQTAAQRILIAAAEVIPAVAAVSRTLGNDEIGNVASSLAMVSAWHEVQYSRLFQS